MYLQRIIHPALPGFFFLLIARCGVATAQKLAVFVGPHETHTGTTTFLSKHAASDGTGDPEFNGWSWPTVHENDIDSSPQHAFDFLVKEQDDEGIQNVLIDAIRSARKTSQKGTFIGSLDFDKVGTNPYSGYDAVEALKRVVDELGVSTDDVIVVVTYRTPRVDQWADVWKNHFEAESYQDFICSDEQSKKRWEWLDTSMNPFKIAKAYHDRDWNVLVVDKESTVRSGKDVANVVACWAMEDENCQDGWINGFDRSVQNITSTGHLIDELEHTDHRNLERLFLLRDCYNVGQLSGSSRFVLLDDGNEGFSSLAKECKNWSANSYKMLSNTSFLMNAIQSQKYCEQDDIDVPSLLAEIYESDVLETLASLGSSTEEDRSSSNSVSEDDTEKEPWVSPADDNPNKRLVVFVGPHETDAVGVTKFFVDYASTSGDSERSSSFDGWIWPSVNNDLIKKPPHRVFDLLVQYPSDEDIQRAVIEAIVDSWKIATNGVIIGSLDFDKTGENPYSDYDPIKALKRVVEALGISSSQVIVSVTYSSPRIDQWSAVWNNHFDTNGYENFVCSDGVESSKRWEWLDTVMNPFKIAKTYRDQGWDVVVIDQEGTINDGLEVAHVIACEVMKSVKCDGGWVTGLKSAVSNQLITYPMDSLAEEDRWDLEQIFRERDCFFKYQLKHESNFSIIHQHTAWSSCSNQHQSFYRKFANTDFVLDLLRSQKQCGENIVDVSKMLRKKMTPNEQKELLIFVGPHETSAVPVTKFFVDHASDKGGTNHSPSFDGWAWPVIDSEILGDIQSHRTFDLLLSDASKRPVQNIILNGIRDSWNNALDGVIIGSLNLDRVGENPYSGYDALGAIQRVVEKLGISDDDVTIALNYRSNRLDHLSAVWWNHFEAESFEEFVCSNAQAEKRWEWIDTVLNPLKLANAYHEEGWKVAMIDQEGTANAGGDVAHALACNLMIGVDCGTGRVRGLENETIDVPSTYKIEDLDELQRTEFETLLQMRDCYYRYTLEQDGKFLIVNKDALWGSCSRKNYALYEKLANTDVLLYEMRSLQGCGDIEPSIFSGNLFDRDTLASSKSSRTVVIGSVVFSTAVFALGAAFVWQLLRKGREAKRNGTEGIFRDGTHDASQEPAFHDRKENDVEDTKYQDGFDDENEGSKPEATHEKVLEEYDVDVHV
ncbi:unnamed protein product [Pseudo-nitzschia multistriata]|uniref:Uncharacterized protein n=1 Tax=Pseudo-nitzschia multistriata TaxID=183589 RepID=A0A448YW44_9STRA|nr:unnamed protein product [Pseudo-nitzschia multistriata]